MLNAPLHEAIAEIARIGRWDSVRLVQVSSSGATGAVILHAWVPGEAHARAVIKTPRDARLDHALEREWAAVQLVRRHRELTHVVPAGLGSFTLRGATYYVYEGAPGSTMYSRFRNRLLWSRRLLRLRFATQAAGILCRIHGTQTRLAPAAEVATDLLSDLAWLERTLPGFPTCASDAARMSAERIARSGDPLPIGRVHGDFSPYNLLTSGLSSAAHVLAIDWEHSEPDRPQHLDVFRFISASALMGSRGRERRAVMQDLGSTDLRLTPALLRPWLEQVARRRPSSPLPTPLLDALWWHYLIHAARREQERRAMPQDFSDSTYVPALARLAGHAVAGARTTSRVSSAAT